jgi:hypothetical protein
MFENLVLKRISEPQKHKKKKQKNEENFLMRSFLVYTLCQIQVGLRIKEDE